MKTGAVLVAAGLSSRMKSFKPLLQLAGSTVIKTAVDTLKSAGVGPIIVVTGREAEALQRHLAPLKVECVYNEHFAQTDMFYSASLGMKAIQGRCQRFFFLPADVPLFSKNSLFTMMGYFDYANCDLLMPRYKNQNGHPVLIKENLIDDILFYNGDRGLKGAIDGLNVKKETLELPDIGLIMDADHPEDYQRLKNYAALMSLQDPLTFDLDITFKRKEPFFSLETARLLKYTENTQSLKDACLALHISYSKGWKLLKAAESQLGFQLLDSKIGGVGGGESFLTENGKIFLENYINFFLEIESKTEEVFQTLFSQDFNLGIRQKPPSDSILRMKVLDNPTLDLAPEEKEEFYE